MSEDKSGGFHFGNVGGDVNIEAGGDVVAGDKVTTVSGFKDDGQKDEFLKQLDELRSSLREIKSQVEGAAQIDQDVKDELVMEVLQQVSELKVVKENVEQVQPGREPPSDSVKTVKTCFEKVNGVLDKIKEFASDVAPVVAKAFPILASVRRLFVIP